MPAPVLPPPPLDNALQQKDGKLTPPWGRWLQQLWDTLREDARAMYYQPTNQSCADGATTLIDFATADISHANVTTGASWKFTATRAGVYHVSSGASLTFPSPTAGTGILILAKNGVEHQRLARLTGVVGLNCLTGSTLIRLATDDYIDVRVFQNTGGAAVLEGGRQNWVAIHRLVGA